jgi:hypothetical protein
MTTININLRLLAQSLIFVMSFNVLLRSFFGSFYGLIELLFLSILFILSLLYYVDRKKYFELDYAGYFYLSFIAYLIIHMILAIITRSFEYDVHAYSFILVGLYEFKNSSITFLFPLLYFFINNNNQEKFEYFLIFVLKIAIIYTIFEQVVSLLGYRDFFITYMQGVIHEIHNPHSTRLGMYRPFGLIGSPHILGILHVIGVIYMFRYKQYKWAILGLLAIFISTSITAYGVMIAITGLYLIYSKKYLWIVIGALLGTILMFIILNRLDYVLGMAHLDEYADLSSFDLFTHQIYGYFLLISNIIDPVSQKVSDAGPLNLIINYFSVNPQNILFGKGMTYLMELRHYDLVQIHNYRVFAEKFAVTSSDFYILNFIEQFGALGSILLITIFFIIPIKKMHTYNVHHVLVLNAFLIATLHYSPAGFFILMMFVGYSVYSLYFKGKQKPNE